MRFNSEGAMDFALIENDNQGHVRYDESEPHHHSNIVDGQQLHK